MRGIDMKPIIFSFITLPTKTQFYANTVVQQSCMLTHNHSINALYFSAFYGYGSDNFTGIIITINVEKTMSLDFETFEHLPNLFTNFVGQKF